MPTTQNCEFRQQEKLEQRRSLLAHLGVLEDQVVVVFVIRGIEAGDKQAEKVCS